MIYFRRVSGVELTHGWSVCYSCVRAGSTADFPTQEYGSFRSPRRQDWRPTCMAWWFHDWRGAVDWRSLPPHWSLLQDLWAGNRTVKTKFSATLKTIRAWTVQARNKPWCCTSLSENNPQWIGVRVWHDFIIVKKIFYRNMWVPIYNHIHCVGMAMEQITLLKDVQKWNFLVRAITMGVLGSSSTDVTNARF